MFNNLKKAAYRFSFFALPIILVGSISGCGPKVNKKNRTEYFAESIYGVKASPRVSKKNRLSPRKGRYHIGKPYKIKGKWYYPSENFAYKKAGSASWYGSSFHGRLTANGEVFDMHKLTAAHATLPLPSYVKVTNLQNNSSLIVRVNDRGPYARNHIIDLSKRAAQMLGYMRQGVTKVRLEYLKKAPLHAQDHDYLMQASLKMGRLKKSPSGDHGDRHEEIYSNASPTVMTALHSTPSKSPSPFSSKDYFDFSDETSSAPKDHEIPSDTDTTNEEVSLPETFDVASLPFTDIQSFSTQEAVSAQEAVQEVNLPDSISIEPIFYTENNISKKTNIFNKLKIKEMTSENIISSWKKMKNINS